MQACPQQDLCPMRLGVCGSCVYLDVETGAGSCLVQRQDDRILMNAGGQGSSSSVPTTLGPGDWDALAAVVTLRGPSVSLGPAVSSGVFFE